VFFSSEELVLIDKKILRSGDTNILREDMWLYATNCLLYVE